MIITIQSGQPSEGCHEFFQTHWPQVNEDIFGWREQVRWQKQYSTVVCEDDDEILGAALFWKMGGVGYLSQLLVAAAQRGRGIGSQLVAAFEGECASCHKLALKTYRDSASQKFYQGLGYQVEAVMENDIHGIDWVYMHKRGWRS